MPTSKPSSAHPDSRRGGTTTHADHHNVESTFMQRKAAASSRSRYQAPCWRRIGESRGRGGSSFLTRSRSGRGDDLEEVAQRDDLRVAHPRAVLQTRAVTDPRAEAHHAPR